MIMAHMASQLAVILSDDIVEECERVPVMMAHAREGTCNDGSCERGCR